jgi:hypothetical protein
MGGQGLVLDPNGNIYVATGNSTIAGQSPSSNASPSPGFDLGESFLKLDPTLNLVDWFTPHNFYDLNVADEDLASSGPALIPGTNRLYGGGKEGRVYLMDTNNLGHYDSSVDHVVQSFQATDPSLDPHHIHGAPIWVPTGFGLNGRIYLWGESNQVRAFRMYDGTFDTTPEMQTALSDDEVARGAMPGGMLSYSGSGLDSGIIWGTHVRNAGGTGQGTYDAGRLWAFDASTLQTLYASTDVPGRDELGNFGKFAPPTIANGRVYVATFSGAVAVYGLLH